MAASIDYILSGDLAGAKNITEATLRARGFELESTPLGGLIAIRTGTRNSSSGFWSGFLGAGGTHVGFIVEFSLDAESRPVVRWNAVAPVGVITGRLAGANPTTVDFQDTADALSEAFAGAGILTDTIASS